MRQTIHLNDPNHKQPLNCLARIESSDVQDFPFIRLWKFSSPIANKFWNFLLSCSGDGHDAWLSLFYFIFCSRACLPTCGVNDFDKQLNVNLSLNWIGFPPRMGLHDSPLSQIIASLYFHISQHKSQR
jgi:hypothetical protein